MCLVAATCNRGDFVAFVTGSHGLTALSTAVNAFKTNGSSWPVEPTGARVTQCCDGHHEKISLEDQGKFESSPLLFPALSPDPSDMHVSASDVKN